MAVSSWNRNGRADGDLPSPPFHRLTLTLLHAQVLRELWETERSYVRYLEVLHRVIAKGLQEKTQVETSLIEYLFGNVYELFEIHQGILWVSSPLLSLFPPPPNLSFEEIELIVFPSHTKRK